MKAFILSLLFFQRALSVSLLCPSLRNTILLSRTMNMAQCKGLNIPGDIQEGLSQLIPSPSYRHHKGEMGRICVIGGSLQYAGAAYYAAMSGLRAGADLMYLVSCREAVPALKAYSPEIMVNPFYLDSNDSVDQLMNWMPRMHVVLIGPGLGTENRVQQNVKSVIEKLKESNASVPLILDADGLRLLALHPGLLLDYKGPVYLTPNKREQEILLAALYGEAEAKKREMESSDCDKIGHNVILVLKGSKDVILSNRHKSLTCGASIAPSSWRRCGGQGDLLAGTLATLAHYAQLRRENITRDDWDMLAAFAACSVVRTTNSFTFQRKGRSMLVSDMLDDLYVGLSRVFPDWNKLPNDEDDESSEPPK